MADEDARRWKAAGVWLVLAATISFGLSGCGSADEPDQAASPKPSHSAVEEHAGALTDAPEADDYCGLIRELNTRAETMAELGVKDQMSAWGANLDYLSASMSMFATVDAERADLWQQASESYAATADFYAVSGQQIANDNLLVLLAEAVADSDAAYLATRERARDECGADVISLITPER